MASLPSVPLSEEEYLRLDRASDSKSEFHEGQMFAMAGGTFAHSRLTANAVMLLGLRKGAGCRAIASGLRIRIPKARQYTYPDAGLVCGAARFSPDGRRDTLLNPYLLVEVLSLSTESYDRGAKFAAYRTIESFREYLLVHPDQLHVEQYSKRPDGSWTVRYHTGGDAAIVIEDIGLRIGLAELYADIEAEPA